MEVDLRAYKAFKRLRLMYPTEMVKIEQGEFSKGLQNIFRTSDEYIAWRFKEKGVRIHRFHTNYDSLSGGDPKLGVIYLASDSVIVPGLEAWVLIGHNAERDV